jgi:hypothetical protein
MSKAYIKGTIKKVFDLKSGEGKRGPWTRLDMVVTKEDDSEQILKVWGGDTLQAYEGATVEAHGKLDEYGGEVRVVADAKDVTGCYGEWRGQPDAGAGQGDYDQCQPQVYPVSVRGIRGRVTP